MGDNNIARRTLIVASAATASGLVVATPADAIVKSRRVDFAAWHPIADRSTVDLTPKRVTIHIAVSNSRDIYASGKIDGTYAHFYNRRSGKPLQHQTLNKRAVADRDGNATSISVEHQGVVGDSMTSSQKTNLAKIFAWAVVYCGVPNRIATVNNVNGLAWHRLGVSGNFGAYDPKDRTTWSRAQTGANWSYSAGKTCPTNKFIRQVGDVYNRAQSWISYYRNPPQPCVAPAIDSGPQRPCE